MGLWSLLKLECGRPGFTASYSRILFYSFTGDGGFTGAGPARESRECWRTRVKTWLARDPLYKAHSTHKPTTLERNRRGSCASHVTPLTRTADDTDISAEGDRQRGTDGLFCGEAHGGRGCELLSHVRAELGVVARDGLFHGRPGPQEPSYL